MTKITTYDKMDAPNTFGTSLKGKLGYGITYNDLVDYFGNPTFGESGDGKVNFEWVIDFEFEGSINTFTIYDWKVDAEWSKNNTGYLDQAEERFGGSRWHIGGKDFAGDFIQFVEKEIKKLEKELPF